MIKGSGRIHCLFRISCLERIIKSIAIMESDDKREDRQKYYTTDGDIINSCHRLLVVPRPLSSRTKSTEIHRIADGFNSFETRKQ